MSPFRHVVSLLLAAWYAVVATGLPMVARPVVTWDTSAERFPCEASACGCANAEQCWQSCCCHTLAQRVAWARREGVSFKGHKLGTPETAAAKLDWPVSKSPVRKQNPGTRSRSASFGNPRQNCGSCGSTETTSEETDQRSLATGRPRALSIIQALACRGQATSWLTAEPVVSPPNFEPPMPLLVHAFALEKQQLYELLSIPPSPPPPQV